MKAIFQGIRYDTETATLIGSAWSNGSGKDISGMWHADLYETPRAARYFLCGTGGPMSTFARSAAENVSQGGRKIIPMTREEAFFWAHTYLDARQVERFFGEYTSGSSTDEDDPTESKAPVRRYTCSREADGDLAGHPASIAGVDGNDNFVLSFDDGSSLAVPATFLRNFEEEDEFLTTRIPGGSREGLYPDRSNPVPHDPASMPARDLIALAFDLRGLFSQVSFGAGDREIAAVVRTIYWEALEKRSSRN